MLVQSYRTSDEGNNHVNNDISHAKQNQQSQHSKTIYFLAQANNVQHSLHIRETAQMEPKSHKYFRPTLIHPLYLKTTGDRGLWIC